MAGMIVKPQPLVNHIGDRMESLIIKGLRLVAEQAPPLSAEREMSSNYADALENDTWLYEAAQGPEQ